MLKTCLLVTGIEKYIPTKGAYFSIPGIMFLFALIVGAIDVVTGNSTMSAFISTTISLLFVSLIVFLDITTENTGDWVFTTIGISGLVSTIIIMITTKDNKTIDG